MVLNRHSNQSIIKFLRASEQSFQKPSPQSRRTKGEGECEIEPYRNLNSLLDYVMFILSQKYHRISILITLHQARTCFRNGILGASLQYLTITSKKTLTAKMKISNFCYRFSTKIYDVITVGPYANKVAKEVSRICPYPPSILGVEEDNFTIESSALPYSDPRIKVNQNIGAVGDLEKGVGIEGVFPNDNKIRLKNGKQYRYRNLVYSGSNWDWKDTARYPGLDSYLQKQNTFIYGDKSYKDFDQILQRILGTVVFIIPKGRHFGGQNYLMLLLQAKMQRRVQNTYPGENAGRVVILNEGQELIENNKAHNDMWEALLIKQGIKHLKNQQLSFNYEGRKVQLKNDKQFIKFDALFHYLPLKVPEVLPFDPFKSNSQTLNHSLYDNVFVLGNVYPTTFSLWAVDRMSKVMARNISYRLMGVRKECLYKGQTKTIIWKNEVEAMSIFTNYNAQRLKSVAGTSQMSRLALGRLYKYGQRPSLEQMINGGFDLATLTENYEQIVTSRNQVPAIYHKSI